MKTKVWIIIIIIVLVGIGVFTSLGTEVSKEIADIPAQDENANIAPFTLLKNTEIVAPDSGEVVQLTNGRGSYEIIPDTSSRGEITILDDVSVLWGEKERTDLAVVLMVNTGGTGTFYYLVLYDVVGNIFTQKSEMLLGDRIRVTHLGIGELVHDPNADYRITAQTLVRKKEESFTTEPTVQETRTFYVTDQLLEEVEVGEDDT